MPAFSRPRRRTVTIAVALVAAVLAASLLAPPAAPITGLATIVDGDTLRLDGGRIRLLGIDAPELDQTCGAASGPWACGVAARDGLAALLANGPVTCSPRGRDRYGRILAHCAAADTDLSRAMVRAGLAMADGDYFADQAAARTARAGIWTGPFTAPAEWRREAGTNGGGDAASATPLGWIRSWFR
jgi:endonuclease YncB( thermonuclease family)